MKTLRIARAEAGMTLKDLANASGVSLSNISKIERGVTRPQAVTLYKLASALGKTAAELAGEEEEPTRPKVLRPRSREELLSNAGIRSRWMLMPKEEFHGWWRGVSYEEARRPGGRRGGKLTDPCVTTLTSSPEPIGSGWGVDRSRR